MVLGFKALNRTLVIVRHHWRSYGVSITGYTASEQKITQLQVEVDSEIVVGLLQKRISLLLSEDARGSTYPRSAQL